MAGGYASPGGVGDGVVGGGRDRALACDDGDVGGVNGIGGVDDDVRAGKQAPRREGEEEERKQAQTLAGAGTRISISPNTTSDGDGERDDDDSFHSAASTGNSDASGAANSSAGGGTASTESPSSELFKIAHGGDGRIGIGGLRSAYRPRGGVTFGDKPWRDSPPPLGNPNLPADGAGEVARGGQRAGSAESPEPGKGEEGLGSGLAGSDVDLGRTAAGLVVSGPARAADDFVVVCCCRRSSFPFFLL